MAVIGADLAPKKVCFKGSASSRPIRIRGDFLISDFEMESTPLLGAGSLADNSNGINNIPELIAGKSGEPKNVTVCGRVFNHNVFLNLIIAALYGVATSLWKDTAYVAYLKMICGGRNEPLGFIQGVSGLAGLVAALPMGWLADHFGRSGVIAAGGALLAVATIAQAEVLRRTSMDEGTAEDQSTALWSMGVLMAAFGVGDCVIRGPALVLIADSTLPGERSKYYNYRFAAFTISKMIGPLVSIVFFRTYGDVWELHSLRVVMYVGLIFQLACSVLMLGFDDDKTLKENKNRDGDEREKGDLPLIDPKPTNASVEREGLTPLQCRQRWIPYIVFIFDLCLALASGMSVKFFPLFFKDEVGMSPSQVQIIYCLVPILMVICSTLGTKLSGNGFGRVQTTILYKLLGVACLYCMVLFKQYLDFHPILLVPIFVLRTSLMNSTAPLQQSLLMDFVRPEVRARWKSLDAVSGFGWSGSAALGGWLSDKFDYTYTFLITAIVQSIGIGVWTLLLPLVPRTEESSCDAFGKNDKKTGRRRIRPCVAKA